MAGCERTPVDAILAQQLGREPLLLKEWAQSHADELLEIAGG